MSFLIEENFLLSATFLIEHTIEDTHYYIVVEPHTILTLLIGDFVVRLYHFRTEFYIDGFLALIQEFQSATLI